MTTPGIAFLTRRLRAGLGVTVSASHSPLEYNGIKLVGTNGLRLQREEEIEIERLIEESTTKPLKVAYSLGQETDGQHLIEIYIQDHVERCPAESLEGLKVVLDCANGAASRVAPEVFRRLGAEAVAVSCTFEGSGINYRCGSEHVRGHPQDLLGVMKQRGALYGFAFDGDGDRLVVVDSDGRVYDGNDLLFVLAMHFHSQGLLRGDTVVTTQIANRGLEEALNRAGIRMVCTSKGDKNLEAAMWGGDHLLGGETGGNIIINDGHHSAADAVYTALVLGGALIQNPGASLRDMAAPLRKRSQVTVSFEISERLTLEQGEMLQARIRDKQAAIGEDGRILYWESSTEPGVFRVMVEGSRSSTLEEVSKTAEAVRRLIEQLGDL
jgi:phosphoglucosamine mutase